MDGVRGYWNGETLLSRLGNVLSCPDSFTSSLPKHVTLDGELWMGRGFTHQNMASVLNSKNSDWGRIGYYIFDIPSSLGSFEERMKDLEVLKSRFAPHIHVVEYSKCLGNQHLIMLRDSVVASKGEGLMLREPNARYVSGQTSSLLKVKVIVFTSP